MSDPSSTAPDSNSRPADNPWLIADPVRVRTSMPIIPHTNDRRPIVTERLLIRPAQPSDFETWRQLRLDPEIMYHTGRGVPDASVEESRATFATMFPEPPGDTTTFRWFAFEKGSGEFVGMGGLSSISDPLIGWPEVGYALVRQHWGKGYATELIKAWLALWWSLPRQEAEIVVDRPSLNDASDVLAGPAAIPTVRERLCAKAMSTHAASLGVLRKAGFQRCDKEISGPDTRPGSPTVGQVVSVTVLTYMRPEAVN
jgi:RimJ/RimL family protein N-acetyltransferase